MNPVIASVALIPFNKVKRVTAPAIVNALLVSTGLGRLKVDPVATAVPLYVGLGCREIELPTATPGPNNLVGRKNVLPAQIIVAE